MPGLVSFADLTEICDRAIGAGLATGDRNVLFSGFSPAIQAQVRVTTSPADAALRTEVNSLNGLVDPTADRSQSSS